MGNQFWLVILNGKSCVCATILVTTNLKIPVDLATSRLHLAKDNQPAKFCMWDGVLLPYFTALP
jgi:hypothetical protein